MLHTLAEHLLAERRRCKTVFPIETLTGVLFSALAVACSNTWEAVEIREALVNEWVQVYDVFAGSVIAVLDVPDSVVLWKRHSLSMDWRTFGRFDRWIPG